ncbi:MAG: DUF2169 domain-containing protein, partial [Candidatus Electrothrix sp. GM3_4]|nr:DUF2169 domain-containing protein [Candidatus Electrothrix sp. GM3_4]
MWMLDNQTPFEAERTWVRDKNGVHQWIVVVKATYDIQGDGTLSLSDNQVEPFHAPVYHEGPESSIKYEADLTAMKPGTDVYLNAIAYAPKGRPERKLIVSFQIDRLIKKLVVYGERTWQQTLAGSLQPSSPAPFVMMPITYERAFGGYDCTADEVKEHRIDTRNPVGSGIMRHTEKLIGKPAPTIEYPHKKLSEAGPAGFGAIASYWSQRLRYAGTYDEQWDAKRKPLLPEDFDPLYFMCSPEDQRIEGYLQGGELIELTNLTQSGYLRFFLPRCFFQFDTYFGSECRPHTSELVSVVIESEEPKLIMVWQTSLTCGNDGEYLDKTVIREIES